MVNIHRVNVQFELNVSSNPMRSFQTHTLNILNTALMGEKKMLASSGPRRGSLGRGEDVKCQILGGLLKRFI